MTAEKEQKSQEKRKRREKKYPVLKNGLLCYNALTPNTAF
jgi:hypothetical protein